MIFRCELTGFRVNKIILYIVLSIDGRDSYDRLMKL